MHAILAIPLMLGILSFAGPDAYEGLSQKEVAALWQQVSVEYEDCTEMPRVVVLEEGTTGGFYHSASNTVVVDRFADEKTWMHEFRHSCGDRLEEACTICTDSLEESIRKYTKAK